MNCKLSLLWSAAFAAFLHGPSDALAQTSLGSAQSFAVLGGSTVTNTGTSVITGDLGVSPGTAITGFPPGLVTGGTIHAADGVALQAQNDVTTAYNALAGQACDTNLTGQDLGGLTLTPGVYCFSSSAQLTGMLTLDAQGTANAEFIFQIGTTLTTATSASVLMINGAQPCNVFWQVGSSATLGTTTSFVGNILALTSITLNTGANLDGRALARNGAVTLDTNNVDASVCGGPTPSPTVTPPATPTATPTVTSGGPTSTPTPVSGGATPTPTPVGGATGTPTPTPVGGATATPTGCPILCVRQDGCFRWELVSADIEQGVITFIWRLTNRCRQPLAAAKFLFTHGNPTVVGMQTGEIYVSPGGFSYTVQVIRGGIPGVMFTARGAGTIRSGQSDLFSFTTTASGIDSDTVYWNSAFTTDGQVGRTDVQVGDCPVGCPTVLDPSARWTMAASGGWDVMVRWNVHPLSSMRLFDLYRVEPGSSAMAQVNNEPMGPHDDGAVTVEDLVPAGKVDRYQIQPLDAHGAAVGASVPVLVEAAPSVVSVDSWLLTLVIAGLALCAGLLHRYAKSR